MKQAKIIEPNRLVIEEGPTPKPSPGEVLIKVMASGICGTDLHIFRGSYLGLYPVVPGHEFAGLIVELGEGVSRFKPGDRVAVEPNLSCNNCVNCLNNRQNFCLNWQAIGIARPGAMAQFVTAPENAVFDLGDVSFEAGSFVEPLSCVLHGLENAKIEMGANVAIIGAGPIGLLLLKAVRLAGAAKVTVADRAPSRVELARRCGADVCLTDTGQLQQNAYDAVVDASGSLQVLPGTLDWARHGGTLLWFGVPPSGATINLEPFKVFRKELSIHSAFTSVRNSHQAVDLLRSGRIAVEDLVSHKLPLDELEPGIELIEKGDRVGKVLILPNG